MPRLLLLKTGNVILVTLFHMFHMPFLSQIYEQLQCRRVIDSNLPEDADEVDGSSEIHCTCLECCGPVSRRFIFEPSSLDSDAHFLINQRNSERFKSDKKCVVRAEFGRSSLHFMRSSI